MTHFNIYNPASKNFNIGGRPDGHTDGHTDGQTDGRTDRQKSVLHRLAFASQLAKNPKRVEQGKRLAEHNRKMKQQLAQMQQAE